MTSSLPHISFFVLNVSASYEPQFYYQAIIHPHWRLTMNAELDAMMGNNTYGLLSLFLQIVTLVIVVGFIKLSTTLMVRLKGIKPVWLLRDIHKKKALIL